MSKAGTMQTDDDFQACAERLKALADPDRLRIVNALLDGPRTVCDLASALEEEVVKVSYHLNILRRANILVAKKQGRFVEYGLHPDVARASSRTVPRHLNLGCCSFQLT
jgi:DNA-binding transcriptional ArsR family regulator